MCQEGENEKKKPRRGRGKKGKALRGEPNHTAERAQLGGQTVFS